MAPRRIRIHFHNHKQKSKPLPPTIEEKTKAEEDKKATEQTDSKAAKGAAEATSSKSDAGVKGNASDKPVSIMPQADFHEENDLNNKLTEDSEDIPKEKEKKEEPVSLLSRLAEEIEEQKKSDATKQASSEQPQQEKNDSSWYKPWTWFDGTDDKQAKTENNQQEVSNAETNAPKHTSFGHVTERASENWERAQKNLEEEGATPFVLDTIATGGEAITDTVREAQNMVGELVPDNAATRGAGHVFRVLPEAAGLITSVTNTESGSTVKAGKRFLKELTFGFYSNDQEPAVKDNIANMVSSEEQNVPNENTPSQMPSVNDSNIDEDLPEITDAEMLDVNQPESNYPRPILSISSAKNQDTHNSISVDIGGIKIDTDKFETKDVILPDEIKELLNEEENTSPNTPIEETDTSKGTQAGTVIDNDKKLTESETITSDPIELNPENIEEPSNSPTQNDVKELLEALNNEGNTTDARPESEVIPKDKKADILISNKERELKAQELGMTMLEYYIAEINGDLPKESTSLVKDKKMSPDSTEKTQETTKTPQNEPLEKLDRNSTPISQKVSLQETFDEIKNPITKQPLSREEIHAVLYKYDKYYNEENIENDYLKYDKTAKIILNFDLERLINESTDIEQCVKEWRIFKQNKKDS